MSNVQTGGYFAHCGVKAGFKIVSYNDAPLKTYADDGSLDDIRKQINGGRACSMGFSKGQVYHNDYLFWIQLGTKN